jgi:chromosomal replication initiator protein
MVSNQAYWPLILEEIQKKVSSSQYDAWFAKLKLDRVQNSNRKITLFVPSKFNRDYIQKKFIVILRESINKYYPKVVHVDFIIQKSSITNEKEKQIKIIKDEITVNGNPEIKNNTRKSDLLVTNFELSELDNTDKVINEKHLLPKQNIHNLNSKFSFDNFIVATYNELAVSVAKSIIKNPGELYNPFFIYSGTGLGKTHLLQAIGTKALELYPSFNIRYITTETFLNHYLNSIHNNKNKEFRDYYRSVDLLLIDDIQFIAGKDSTQEAFFYTFNELHQNNKQIIITSDKPPKSLGGIEERLISRFEWGMVVDLSQPTIEDRMAIIQNKLEKLNLNLNPNQVLKVAKTIQTNIRDIEGALNKIKANRDLNNHETISDDLLDNILNPFHGIVREGLMQFTYEVGTNRHILEQVGNHYMVSIEDLISKKRDKKVSLARQVVMHILHRVFNLNVLTIGKFLGNRDHSTVVHGCQKVGELLDVDANFKQTYNKIVSNLQLR